MKVSEAVQSRLSVRDFLDTPVPRATLETVLRQAARAASGGNLQPWRIYAYAGEPLAAFKAKMRALLAGDPTPGPVEYEVYPDNLWEPYRTQRFRVGEAMYALLGIPREDKMARLRWLTRNYDFFGAPAALFCYIDRKLGPPQWSDLGMYLQTVMLLLREHGLSSCAQECWSRYHAAVRELTGASPELMLFCGMAIGHADPAAPVNSLESERMALEEFATFRGFETDGS